MDENKRELIGSEKHDIFKRKHKDLPGGFYATDCDFALVNKHPPGTVAYLDYKDPNDSVTFAEAIQYNEWMKTAPVYIVEGASPETGPFVIRRYLGGNWRPDPPDVNWGDEVIVDNWEIFGLWEWALREEYIERGGWCGNLIKR